MNAPLHDERPAHGLRALVSKIASPLAALCLLLATGPSACNRDASPEPGAPAPETATTLSVDDPSTTVERAGAPDVDPDDTAVARAPDIEVTLADYRRELSRGALERGEPWNDRTLADPFFQRNQLTRLLKRAAMREAAAERGVEITDAEIRAELARRLDAPELAEADDAAFEALLASKKSPVDRAAMWRFTRDDLLVDKMTESLLAELDDDDLWKQYEAARSRIGLEVVRLLNVPSSAEITEAVAARKDEIARWYAENKARYFRRESVTLRRMLVAVPADADDAAVEAARDRAEALRRQALTGDFADLASRHSDDILTSQNGGLMPPVAERQAGAAFSMKVGEIGPVTRVRDGFEFVRIEGRTPESMRELGPGVEREIASILIQEDGPAPSVAAVGQRVLDAWRAGADAAAIDELLAGQRADRYDVAPFGRDAAGRIPSLGYVPYVFEAAWQTTPETPVAAAPIADGEYVYVFRVTSREQADRLRFTAEREHFRAQVIERERPRILWFWLDQRLGNKLELDLRTIQRHYGVLQKDGSIAGLESPPG